MNDQQYYADKTMVSHSMLCNFVEYDEYGNRDIFPEDYYIKHIKWVEVVEEPTDPMMIWTIIDRYIWEWPHILDEYPVVSRRNWDNPKEITKSMWESINKQIQYIKVSPSFSAIANDPTTRKQTVFTRDIILPNGTMKLKWKTDFDNLPKNYIADWKAVWLFSNMFKWMQFKHDVNLRARYIRQLAFYMFISWQDENENFYWILLVSDSNGRIKAIKIRKEILDAAWSIIKNDLIELQEFYNNWFSVEDMIIDPFNDIEEVAEDDRL